MLLFEEVNGEKKSVIIMQHAVLFNVMTDDDGVKMKVIPTPGHWYGMTFREDVPVVQEVLKQMAEQGLYPTPLQQA